MPNVPVTYLYRNFAERNTNPGSNQWETTLDQGGSVTLWNDIRTRNKNPQWRDKISKGLDASTYYKASYTTYHLSRAEGWGIWDNTPTGPRWEVRGYATYIGSLPVFQPTDAVTRDQALMRVKRRIASLEESYQLLIPLVELRELRGLVKEMLHLTFNVVIALSRAKRTGGRSVWREVSKIWLMYSFGISPMMSDLKDIANSLWAYLTKGDVRDRVQGSAKKTFRSSMPYGEITGLASTPLGGAGEAQHEVSYRFIAGWKFLLRSSNDYTAANHFGIKPPALIPALWELTAFSWVVDYFTTVGDFLEDVFVGQAGSAIYVVENRRYTCRSVWTYSYQWPKTFTHPTLVRRNRAGFTVIDYVEFERTPLSALPSRSLRWKTQDEIGLHALNKLMNLISVLGAGRKR